MSLTKFTDQATPAEAVDPIITALLAGTLSDDEVLGHLIERKENFLARTDTSLRHRVRGARLFNRAINHEYGDARRDGTPVAVVLKQVLINLALLLQSGDNTPPPRDSAVGETSDSTTNNAGPSGTTTGERSDKGSKIAGKHNGQKGEKTANNGRCDGPSKIFKTPPPPPRSGNNQMGDVEGRRTSKRIKTGLVDDVTNDEVPRDPNPGRCNSTISQNTSCISQSGAAATPETPTKFETVHISLRTGRVCAEKKGLTKPQLIVRLPFNWSKAVTKAQDEQKDQSDQETWDTPKSKAKDTVATETDNDQDDQQDWLTTSPLASPPVRQSTTSTPLSTKMPWGNPTFQSSMSHSSTPRPPLRAHTTFTFPPFPPFPERELEHFIRGVAIAIENLGEGHQEVPELTLLELVAAEEEGRPTVSDWIRLAVLRGGDYVFEAVKGAVAEDSDDEEGGDVEGEVIERLIEQLAENVELMKAQAEKEFGSS